MKKLRFAKQWSFTRFIRLGLGVFIIGEGIHTREWGFMLFGTLVLLSSILNFGLTSCDKQCCCESQPNVENEKH